MITFDELKKELEKLLINSWSKDDLKHAHQTLDILIKLYPRANVSMKIAAFGHDIDRSLENHTTLKKDFPSKKDYLDAHAKSSANALAKIMKEKGFSKETILTVRRLVEKHEIGGNFEEQLICDADAITFFQYYAEEYFISRGKNVEKTRLKFKEVFNRISRERRIYLYRIKYSEPILNVLLQEVLKS